MESGVNLSCLNPRSMFFHPLDWLHLLAEADCNFLITDFETPRTQQLRSSLALGCCALLSALRPSQGGVHPQQAGSVGPRSRGREAPKSVPWASLSSPIRWTLGASLWVAGSLLALRPVRYLQDRTRERPLGLPGLPGLPGLLTCSQPELQGAAHGSDQGLTGPTVHTGGSPSCRHEPGGQHVCRLPLKGSGRAGRPSPSGRPQPPWHPPAGHVVRRRRGSRGLADTHRPAVRGRHMQPKGIWCLLQSHHASNCRRSKVSSLPPTPANGDGGRDSGPMGTAQSTEVVSAPPGCGVGRGSLLPRPWTGVTSLNSHASPVGGEPL